MAVKMICDNCGMAEPHAVFTSAPIMLQIQNYKNEAYNFYVTIQNEKASDGKKIEEFMQAMANRKNERAVIKALNPNKDMEQEMWSDLMNQLDNPSPMLCNRCKRKLASFLIEYGSPYALKDF